VINSVTLCNKLPFRRSDEAPCALSGDLTQGSQQYSIWTTCVDWHALNFLCGWGLECPLRGPKILNVAYFTESPETELLVSSVRPFLVQLVAQVRER
jgi:hypothetical protein